MPRVRQIAAQKAGSDNPYYFLIRQSIWLLAGGAVMLGLPMPLTAVQLLWLHLVTNGAQDVMLGFGRGEGDELKQAPRSPSKEKPRRTLPDHQTTSEPRPKVEAR